MIKIWIIPACSSINHFFNIYFCHLIIFKINLYIIILFKNIYIYTNWQFIKSI
jgi:hypothetical protein